MWHLLNDEGPQTFPQLKKKLHGSGELLSFALGWLAREDKVDITLNSHSSRLLASEKHVSDPSPALVPRAPSPQGRGLTSNARDVLRLKLVGANPAAKVTSLDELPGKANYFLGNDPRKWRANIPAYAKIRYENVYPGVDVVYHGRQDGQLEYDFVVAPAPTRASFNSPSRRMGE